MTAEISPYRCTAKQRYFSRLWHYLHLTEAVMERALREFHYSRCTVRYFTALFVQTSFLGKRLNRRGEPRQLIVCRAKCALKTRNIGRISLFDITTEWKKVYS